MGDPLNPLYAVPKTNQTYVWGLTRIGNSLWFGTGANVMCTTEGLFVEPTIIASSTYVCEYAASQIARTNPLVSPEIGDVRPPRIYEYDLTTKTLIDRTPTTRRSTRAWASALRVVQWRGISRRRINQRPGHHVCL